MFINNHLAFNSSCADGCVAVELCVHALPSEIHYRQTVMNVSKDQGLIWTKAKICQSRICHNHAVRRKKPRSISLAGCNQEEERFKIK